MAAGEAQPYNDQISLKEAMVSSPDSPGNKETLYALVTVTTTRGVLGNFLRWFDNSTKPVTGNTAIHLIHRARSAWAARLSSADTDTVPVELTVGVMEAFLTWYKTVPVATVAEPFINQIERALVQHRQAESETPAKSR